MGAIIGLLAALIPILGVIFIIALIMGVRIINQYERGVIFRFGRVMGGVKEPGFRFIIPIVDVMRKVDMRIITLPVQSQKIITRDNVSIDVAAVATTEGGSDAVKT